MGGKCKLCERWYKKKADHKCCGPAVKCDVCEHIFADKYKLSLHKNRKKPCVKPLEFKTVRVNETTKKCTTCSKVYPFYYNHICPGPLSCDVCHKVFTNQGNLTQHKNKKIPCRPKNDEPLECSLCHKVFTNKGNLTMHKNRKVPCNFEVPRKCIFDYDYDTVSSKPEDNIGPSSLWWTSRD